MDTDSSENGTVKQELSAANQPKAQSFFGGLSIDDAACLQVRSNADFDALKFSSI